MESIWKMPLAAAVLMCLSVAPVYADDAVKAGTMAAEPLQNDPMAAGTMAADPMATNAMSTNAMSGSMMAADPAKAQCLDDAASEPDAAKRQQMLAACDAMAGGAMMGAQPQQ